MNRILQGILKLINDTYYVSYSEGWPLEDLIPVWNASNIDRLLGQVVGFVIDFIDSKRVAVLYI